MVVLFLVDADHCSRDKCHAVIALKVAGDHDILHTNVPVGTVIRPPKGEILTIPRLPGSRASMNQR